MSKSKKTVTFIIGNGFDCKYKWKVSYDQFLGYYLRISTGKNEVLKCFKDKIRAEKKRKSYGSWSDLEIKMGSYETETLEEFCTCYDDISHFLSKYIKGVVEKNKGLPEEDLKDPNLFHNGFMHFLVHFTEVATDDPQGFSVLNEIYCSIKSTFSFILLNYTPLLENGIKYLLSPERNFKPFKGEQKVKLGKVLQPHGDLDNIVFGVSDVSQICKKFANEYEYRRRILKEERIKYLGKTWLEDGKKMINNSDLIAIFGASIGASDNHWWRMIAEWLAEDGKRNVLIYYYWRKKRVSKKETARQQEEKVRELKARFRSFAANAEDISKRIFITFEPQKFLEMFVPLQAEIMIPTPKLDCEIDLAFGPHADSAP